MNRHFNPLRRNPEDVDFHVPSRTYGRIDHVEIAPQATVALVAIDLVDADWVDAQGQGNDPRFSQTRPHERARAWRDHARKVQLGAKPPNPFEKAPLFRLELHVRLHQTWLGFPPLPTRTDPTFESEIGALERTWVELFDIRRTSFNDPDAGLLYPGLFDEPVPVLVSGRMPTPQQGAALDDIFSLGVLPSIDTYDVELALSKASTNFLVTYDVGQGNANALLDSGHMPTLYYDLGAGVYRNKKTTPSQLHFCFTRRPTIVLSHWDADHWAGACATSVNGTYPAKLRDWIAPMQKVGPTHIAFAHDIVTSGGQMFIYSPAPGTVGSTGTATNHALRSRIGSGSYRNGSGIVLAIENSIDFQSSAGCWLLTGDCDYQHFMPALTSADPVAMVAPHHGADLHAASPIPSPAPFSAYRRLAYSFGPANAHGGGAASAPGGGTAVRHPTVGGTSAHGSAGWSHGAWSIPGSWTPGVGVAGADVLATCEHPPGTMRGGAIVGWTSAPAVYQPPCIGSQCNAPVTQN